MSLPISRRRPAAQRSPHAPAFAAALVVALAVAGAAGPVCAQSQDSAARPDAVVRFDIAAKPLAEALGDWAVAARTRLVVAPALVAGRAAPAVRGSLTRRQALDRLLAGSGLVAVDEGGAVVVQAAPPAAAAAGQVLPVVTVKANAEPAAGEPPKPYAGGQVARGGRLGLLGDTDFMETPFSTFTLTEQALRDIQARTVADSTRYIPTVFQPTNSASIDNRYAIRSFPAAQRLNGLQGLSGSNNLVSNRAGPYERVEVITGASALLTGEVGGLGGSINLVTKRAGDDPLLRVNGSFQSASQFGGDLDVGRRFGADNEFGARVNLDYASGRPFLADSLIRTRTASVALDYRGEQLRATLDYIYDAAVDRNVVLIVTPFDPDKPLDLRKEQVRPQYFGDTRPQTAVARVEYDLAPASTIALAYGRSRSSAENNGSVDLAAYGVPPPGPGLFTTASGYSAIKQRNTSLEANAGSRFATGPVSHRLVLSATRVVQTVDQYDVSPPSTTVADDDPRRFDLVGHDRSDSLAQVTPNVSSRLTSLAAVDTLGFARDTVLLTAGVRRQRIDDRQFDYPTDGSVVSRYRTGATTPALAALYKVDPRVSIYASYIEGLERGPTAPDNSPGVLVTNAGQVFAPYKSRQYEAGAKLDFGKLGVTVAAFQLAQPNAILTPSDTPGTFTFGLDGEQRNRGVEVNAFGEPAVGVRLFGGVALLQAKLRHTEGGVNEGNTAGSSPKRSFKAHGEWDLAALSGLTLTGGLQAVGRQFVDGANTRSFPSYAVFDVGARYRTRGDKPVVVRLDVLNVGDKLYYSTGYYGFAGSIGSPRTVSMSTSIDF